MNRAHVPAALKQEALQALWELGRAAWPAVDLPAGMMHHTGTQPPVSLAFMPTGGAIHGFRFELRDKKGHPVPNMLLHHLNVVDPSHRELFLPISRRVLAAGGETGEINFPWLLVGQPLIKGQRLVVSAMLHNPTTVSYKGVKVRIVMYYVPEGRPWPLLTTYPFQLDVAFPVGNKDFDVPPGHSERSYEGSPAIAGTIMAVGGHVHDYGSLLELSDATTGEIIWKAQPEVDTTGGERKLTLPIGKLYGWTRLGWHIVPEHRYRVTVAYDNPTGHLLTRGGMGVVGGLFVPDHDAAWPDAAPSDSLYAMDERHYLRLIGRDAMSDAMAETDHSSAGSFEHPPHH